jgi:hypothetical protein
MRGKGIDETVKFRLVNIGKGTYKCNIWKYACYVSMHRKNDGEKLRKNGFCFAFNKRKTSDSFITFK